MNKYLPMYPQIEEDFEICDPCVVRPWIDDLTYKQQTVLFSAIRGCDGVAKEDVSKKLMRAYRSVILRNAAPGQGRFMKVDVTPDDVKNFLNNLDPYPMHWLFHFLHAVEIIGYKHPIKSLRLWWFYLYEDMVDALHLRPETEKMMDERLSDGFSRDCWKT